MFFETRLNQNVYHERLEKNDDLIDVITQLLKEKKIYSGSFSEIGALSKANLTYYNQKKQKYFLNEFIGEF